MLKTAGAAFGAGGRTDPQQEAGAHASPVENPHRLLKSLGPRFHVEVYVDEPPLRSPGLGGERCFERRGQRCLRCSGRERLRKEQQNEALDQTDGAEGRHDGGGSGGKTMLYGTVPQFTMSGSMDGDAP